MRTDDPGKRNVKDSLLGGFSPLLAKLKERSESRKELIRRLRDSLFTWQPAERRHTKKPINRKARRKKGKAVRQARKLNRTGKGRPKGYR